MKREIKVLLNVTSSDPAEVEKLTEAVRDGIVQAISDTAAMSIFGDQPEFSFSLTDAPVPETPKRYPNLERLFYDCVLDVTLKAGALAFPMMSYKYERENFLREVKQELGEILGLK